MRKFQQKLIFRGSVGENMNAKSSLNHCFVFRPGDYTLRLKYSSAGDAGRLECQVSTSPKISQTFYLNVIGK
jgi:hypothetical protein